MSEEQAGSHAVRASDEDRERLAAELQEHTVAGRLSAEELEQRLSRVYAASTTAELEAVRSDLPASIGAQALALSERRSHLRRRLVQETGGALTVFAACTLIWLVSGAEGQFWPVWILIVVLVTFARSGWALFGPAPDLDAAERHLDSHRDRRLERDRRRTRRRLGP